MEEFNDQYDRLSYLEMRNQHLKWPHKLSKEKFRQNFHIIWRFSETASQGRIFPCSTTPQTRRLRILVTFLRPERLLRTGALLHRLSFSLSILHFFHSFLRHLPRLGLFWFFTCTSPHQTMSGCININFFYSFSASEPLRHFQSLINLWNVYIR